MRRRLLQVLFGAVVVSATAWCQSAASEGERTWQALRRLEGEWKGTGGGGQPGEVSASGATFRYELKEHVLVRRSFTAFKARPERAAFQHDDLTVIYPGMGSAAPRAVYFDDEGHSIEYNVTATAGGQRIECLSPVAAGMPRFRLTYEFTGADAMKIRFDIAPPGTEKFTTHVEGTLHRIGK
ncbi:MAG: hypothetical protein ABSC08_18120 [Bryobacteraceae bacterium]|jgi:hypothetical protein